jgi:NAD(P)-dependent dehydrogenase (short-subunit alcohol dehydrogenase family)
MSSIDSIRNFSLAFQKLNLPLNVLMHNAGLSNNNLKINSDGLEDTMAVNYINVVLLTSLLLPILKKSGRSRIVLVGSSAHHQGSKTLSISLGETKKSTNGWQLYGSSKLNLIAYGSYLGKTLTNANSSVSVSSLDPGFVSTPFYSKDVPFPISVFGKLANIVAKSPKIGAHSQLYASLSPVALPNGSYLADTLDATPSALSRDELFQKQIVEVTVSKLKKIAPWWDGVWN